MGRKGAPERAEEGRTWRQPLKAISFHASFWFDGDRFCFFFLIHRCSAGGVPLWGLMFEWWRGEGGPPNSTVLITDLTSILAIVTI